MIASVQDMPTHAQCIRYPRVKHPIMPVPEPLEGETTDAKLTKSQSLIDLIHVNLINEVA